jgi:hypothetical protein
MAADDERHGPGADPRRLSFAVLGTYGSRPAAIGLYAVTTALLVGGWAMLSWLLLPLARRA